MNSIFVDWKVNRGDLRIQLALALFRLAHAARTQPGVPSPIGRLASISYRLLVEWSWGIELPWQTVVGPRLRIYHGTGIVVHAEAVLGEGVVLRQGVCIGERIGGGGVPHVADFAEFGANSMVLGPCTVGSKARVGAGAVVLVDVPDGGTAIGNPARVRKPQNADLGRI